MYLQSRRSISDYHRGGCQATFGVTNKRAAVRLPRFVARLQCSLSVRDRNNKVNCGDAYTYVGMVPANVVTLRNNDN